MVKPQLADPSLLPRETEREAPQDPSSRGDDMGDHFNFRDRPPLKRPWFSFLFRRYIAYGEDVKRQQLKKIVAGKLWPSLDRLKHVEVGARQRLRIARVLVVKTLDEVINN